LLLFWIFSNLCFGVLFICWFFSINKLLLFWIFSNLCFGVLFICWFSKNLIKFSSFFNFSSSFTSSLFILISFTISSCPRSTTITGFVLNKLLLGESLSFLFLLFDFKIFDELFKDIEFLFKIFLDWILFVDQFFNCCSLVIVFYLIEIN
jgi:hypothetical protein